MSDDRLVAAVNVSTQDDDNFLADLDADYDDDEDDDDDEPRRRAPKGDFRTIIAESTSTSTAGTGVAPATDPQRLNRISSTSPSLTW